VSDVRQGAGLSFSEVMAGPLSLADGTRGTLVMRVTLVIPSAEAFVADPDHHGILSGTISADGIGSDLPIVSGYFQLFAPSDDPRMTRMVYHASVVANGCGRTIQGEKHLRRGGLLRSWAETTTLHCRVSGADGRAEGEGTLRITPAGFVRQLLTFRGINGSGTLARAGALARFFGFFSSQLLHAYVLPAPAAYQSKAGGR
jgi:hypothetical protein